MMKHQIISLLFSFSCILNTADAASFDCSTASGVVEEMICNDAELSKIDDKLGAIYRKALKTSKTRKLLKTQQRAWLAEIRNHCHDPLCLKTRYEERIKQLSSDTPILSPPNGSFECITKSNIDDEKIIDRKKLFFKFHNGRLIDFTWEATLFPKGFDLRPSMHYSGRYTLSKMKQRLAPGFLILEQIPAKNFSSEMQESCGIVLFSHKTRLYVFTVGCENYYDTYQFDYIFNQTGSQCQLAKIRR